MSKIRHFNDCIRDIEIPTEWRDVSYLNDVCPSFICGGFLIFIEHANVELREMPDEYRFWIFPENYQDLSADEYHGNPVYACNDLDEANFFVNTFVWTNDNRLAKIWYTVDENLITE